MKKRKLNNYFKFGILLVGILTILVNCDKDNFDDSSSFEDPSKPINKAIIVSHNEIPHIIDAVMELTGEKALKSAINFKTHKNRNAHIDIKKVLKVKNKEGFNNYTFRINVENNSSNVFYNMIVREEVDKKVKKPFIYKYVIDQDALPAFVASGKDMRYFKGMRYLLSYSKFLKEDRTINREPEQSETILEEECSNIENDGIPIVPQIMPISSSVGSGDPYYQYGGGYIYPSYYLYPTYTYPKTSNDSQTNNTTPNNPVTGVYGTNAPTTSITSGGVDPQLNTGYPTYSNDYGGSFGNTTYNYNFILDDNGVVNISNLDGGGGASCIQINIAYYGNYMFISVSSCNLMQYYAQRTALLDPDCPDPQGTIGVLPPEDPCPIAGYTKDVNGN